MELLHGITFGVFYSVMATYASVLSPPGSAATVQGIFGAAFEGFGKSNLTKLPTVPPPRRIISKIFMFFTFVGVAIGSLVGGILHQLVRN